MTSDSESSRLQHAPSDNRETYVLVLPWDLRDDSGGVNQVVRSLYDGVARDGRIVPITLVLSWGASEEIAQRDSAGRAIIKFRLMSFDERGSPLLSALRYLCRLPGELWRLRRFVKEHRVAIVNCHYIGASEPLWIIAKVVGIFRGKILLSLHGKDIRTLAELGGFRKRFWRWVLQRATAIVACSVGLATETVEKFALSPSHVVTIYNGFDTARVKQSLANAAPADPQVAPRLLNFGTFEYKKGHDVLLRAFGGVLERFPSAHLTIMGRRAETFDQTVRLVDELGLRESVSLRFDVPHDLALAALRESHVFVLSSRNEAFSVALLEAGAFAKPVVATNVCGVAELIENDTTGIVVPSEDAAALTRGMLAMLENPKAALRYGERLRERVVTSFRAEQTTASYLSLAGFPVRDGDARAAAPPPTAGEYVAHGHPK